MTLFRLDASIRTHGSASREIADIVEAEWLAAHPGDPIERRHIGVDALPATAWAAAVTAGTTAPEEHTAEQRAALALAATLVDVLLAADAVLFAVPLYNYGVSQHFKTYVDLVSTDQRAFGEPFLAGKRVVLVTVRGGAYGGGTPREGWDHATPYLRRIIADCWGADLTVVEREFTLVGVNPALDPFTDQAATMHAEALQAAREAGRALGAVPVPA
ncbi:FMN-dependent NADH-azoreductase [Verrucosispora sioxanthis]|uniref:FMN dependent NADH:quinone oxidoreductase n=1 Tax=Verrucosispora sioxanthis TaxID=2499994 RepID=A0A6M1L0Z3_9ACTN|nr:NAD(P)H-dependent oxidoreductase [Verrucosispora sioxanthis]NEE62437.1 flavodoxin family protein [Verrucosispora sioxanthis]NGM11547.1 flavodoxin family protein [Verrucosispora sioxanthis]